MNVDVTRCKADWSAEEKADFMQKLLEKLFEDSLTEQEIYHAVEKIEYNIPEATAVDVLLALSQFISIPRVVVIDTCEDDIEASIDLPNAVILTLEDSRKILLQYSKTKQKVTPL